MNTVDYRGYLRAELHQSQHALQHIKLHSADTLLRFIKDNKLHSGREDSIMTAEEMISFSSSHTLISPLANRSLHDKIITPLHVDMPAKDIVREILSKEQRRSYSEREATVCRSLTLSYKDLPHQQSIDVEPISNIHTNDMKDDVHGAYPSSQKNEEDEIASLSGRIFDRLMKPPTV